MYASGGVGVFVILSWRSFHYRYKNSGISQELAERGDDACFRHHRGTINLFNSRLVGGIRDVRAHPIN